MAHQSIGKLSVLDCTVFNITVIEKPQLATNSVEQCPKVLFVLG